MIRVTTALDLVCFLPVNFRVLKTSPDIHVGSTNPNRGLYIGLLLQESDTMSRLYKSQDLSARLRNPSWRVAVSGHGFEHAALGLGLAATTAQA